MRDDSRPQRTACGFVLVRRAKGRFRYLLLRNRNRSEFGLPKGHAEAEEGELETALRETTEETGLTDLRVLGRFRAELRYEATRDGRTYDKTVVYFAARLLSGEVQLSEEHDEAVWLPLPEAQATLPFDSLRGVLHEAALFLKDPALFEQTPATEADALAHLVSLPEAQAGLIAHLQGGARLARTFAEALAAAGKRIDVEATAAGTLLHDVGRALGEHADHPRAGTIHLRTTPLAAYGFGCISHFTKGAKPNALIRVGVSEALVHDFDRLVDMRRMTWEERCCALADACMKQDTPVSPTERFADLRLRYPNHDLIAMQERRTAKIRRKLAKALGRDPLALVGLA